MNFFEYCLENGLNVCSFRRGVPKGYTEQDFIKELKLLAQSVSEDNALSFDSQLANIILKTPTQPALSFILSFFYDEGFEPNIDIEEFEKTCQRLFSCGDYSEYEKIRIQAIVLSCTIEYVSAKERFEVIGRKCTLPFFIDVKGKYVVNNITAILEDYCKQVIIYLIEEVQGLPPIIQVETLEKFIRGVYTLNIPQDSPVCKADIRRLNDFIESMPSLRYAAVKRAEMECLSPEVIQHVNPYPHIFTNKGYQVFKAFLDEKQLLTPTDYAFVFRALEREDLLLDVKHAVYLEVLCNDFNVELTKIHAYSKIASSERLLIFNAVK
ncbi:hypothetical protein [Aestuariibaculum suncheonense]|uniref:Uncharacterized protein n=1 Tax=Aestuariibaculum suncheonense TaxID=1028745 RepID=A0A8J6Q9Y2_9FLAO|nr:hypothetical protein [Aestuariibaculum suncheonense]MBD0836336.1 hypothetical protein [Aestuariibaculum suncheonense]